jgi:glycosyltransferase involved in cell wall biosynthesis
MISILTSTYNNEQWLNEFLDSVISQTYTDWELILVDDGSTDNTREIINSYNDTRIKYIYKEHTNLPDSLNVGYDYCKGDYIARADADDIMMSDRLQYQWDFMESHQDVDMSATAAIYKDMMQEHRLPIIVGTYRGYVKPADALRTTCLWHGSWIVRTSTWKRDKIYYDTDYYCGQDFEYMLNCICHGWTLYNCGEYRGMYRRIHNDCIVVNHKKDRYEKYDIARNKYKNLINEIYKKI